MTKHADRLRWWWTRKVKFRLWSAQNWLKGYKFGPIQRHRCCQHTTPPALRVVRDPIAAATRAHTIGGSR